MKNALTRKCKALEKKVTSLTLKVTELKDQLNSRN